jgi:cell division protein FtsB
VRRLLATTVGAVGLSGEQVTTALLAATIVWLAASTTLGPNGLHQLRDLRQARTELAAAAIETGNRIAALQETRERLRADDAYLERVARDELGLVYPDEVVYRFRTADRVVE